MTPNDSENLKSFTILLDFLPETAAALRGSTCKITAQPVPEFFGAPNR